MKPGLFHTIQNLGDRVTRLREAIHSAPHKAAQMRQAAVVTADQLRQVRAEVQSGIAELRADGEGRLADALREISDNEDVLHEAGFALTGLDMELGTGARLIVHLERFLEVGPERLRGLAETHRGRSTLRGLLNALVQGEELAARVHVPNLEYRALTVFMGPVPSVRVGWRWAESEVSGEPAPGAPPRLEEQPPRQAAPIRAVPTDPAGPSRLGPIGTLFERPFMTGTAGAGTHSTAGPASAADFAAKPAAPGAASGLPGSSEDWRKHALDRFKKMPDLSRGGGGAGESR